MSPFTIKLASLGAIGVVLLVALAAVHGIVFERQQRRAEAERSVAGSLAGTQTIVGPLLHRDCQETWTHTEGDGKDRKVVADHREFRQILFPRHLDVVTSATIDPRYRGLFKVNGFASRSTIRADWDDVAGPVASAALADARVRCDAVVVSVGVSDSRGVRSAAMRLGGVDVGVTPGGPPMPNGRGFHAELPDRTSPSAPLRVDVDLALVGTGSLAWVPVGDETRVHATSDWRHPAFGGQFLPMTRDVDAHGFDARWQVSRLATSAQQAVSANSGTCTLDGGDTDAHCVDSFGVRFIDPVDGYVLGDRAIRYGALFIGLTFVAVALVEVTRRLRVHPMQYLLVGAALTVFFLLLVSLSEHVGFGIAYGCASAACTLLLTFYGVTMLRGTGRGVAFGAAIAALYATLYVVLQMEQTALILGTSLVFAALAAVMVVTRRLNWYEVTARRIDPAEPASTAHPG